MFDAIYQVNLHETQCKVSDQEALCETIGTALEMGGARTGRDLVRALQVRVEKGPFFFFFFFFIFFFFFFFFLLGETTKRSIADDVSCSPCC